MTNDEENNNEKEESLIDAGMSNTEKESCTIDYFSTDEVYPQTIVNV